MRNTFLPFSPPLIGEEEIAEVVDTLRSDWITTGRKEQGCRGAWGQGIGSGGAGEREKERGDDRETEVQGKVRKQI